ncbi:MAG TPA: hypothetical protein VFH51_08430, partial [Myxococcota bacterium]|nr:hypothetical protein [Myxococcota bacterium]
TDPAKVSPASLSPGAKALYGSLMHLYDLLKGDASRHRAMFDLLVQLHHPDPDKRGVPPRAQGPAEQKARAPGETPKPNVARDALTFLNEQSVALSDSELRALRLLIATADRPMRNLADEVGPKLEAVGRALARARQARLLKKKKSSTDLPNDLRVTLPEILT